MIKWNSKYKPEKVLLKLEELGEPQGGGKIKIKGLNVDYEDCCQTLEFMIDSDYKNYFFVRRSFEKTIIRYLHEVGDETERSKFFLKILKDEIKKIDKKYINYTVLLSLNHDNYLFPSDVTIDDVYINFNTGEYHRKIRDVVELKKQIPNKWLYNSDDEINFESNYTPIVASCRAISNFEAKYKIDRSIDIFRGIYSLFVNYSYENFNIDKYSPVNKLSKSKYSILNDGKYDALFFEPRNFSFPKFQYHGVHDLKDLLFEYINDIEKKDAKYSKILKDSLVKFCRALDEVDPNICMIKLWSALEDLLSGENENNKERMVSRFSSIAGGDEHVYQSFEQIRALRNKYVHESFLLENVRKKCFVISNYYKAILNFHLKNFFNSHEESIRAMDLLSKPNEFKKLKNTVEIVDSLLKK